MGRASRVVPRHGDVSTSLACCRWHPIPLCARFAGSLYARFHGLVSSYEPLTAQGVRCSVPPMLLARSCNSAWLPNSRAFLALVAAFCTSAIAGGRGCWDTSFVRVCGVGEPTKAIPNSQGGRRRSLFASLTFLEVSSYSIPIHPTMRTFGRRCGNPCYLLIV